MTAPLNNALYALNPHKIAMTAPVQQQAVQQQAVQQQVSDNLWQISFIMPLAYTLQTLPPQ